MIPMLYRMAVTEDQAVFDKCYDSVFDVFYNEDALINDNVKEMLPSWDPKQPLMGDKFIREVKKAAEKIAEKVCDTGGYKCFDEKGSLVDDYSFPAMDRYYKYFAVNREWKTPYRNPADEIKNIFRLYRPDVDAAEMYKHNYSSKCGDYNHFVNVVAAMARLIKYCSKSENIVELLEKGSAKEIKQSRSENQKYADIVLYDFNDKFGIRIFMLMLAAFYHDIGKTVVYHRHGMEGALIIGEHTSKSWHKLKVIAAAYGFNDEFEREDLLFIADLVEYHDLFGTLSTGEAGYLRLIEIVEKIKRYSLKKKVKEEQIKLSKQCLFDLWLLNIADVMVSVKDKWDIQECWKSAEFDNGKMSGPAEERIKGFFSDKEKSRNLIHDLRIADKLLNEVNEHRHSDAYVSLSESAVSYSDRHVVERIRRLVYSTVKNIVKKHDDGVEKVKAIIKQRDDKQRDDDIKVLEDQIKLLKDKKKISEYKNDIKVCEEERSEKIKYLKDNELFINILGEFKSVDSADQGPLSEQFVDITIVNAIESMRDFRDFSRRFTWIGQMDYSLGFFQEIFDRVLNRVQYEIQDIGEISSGSSVEDIKQYCFRTKWVRDKNARGFDKKDLCYLQSKLLVENYVMTLVMILDLLLFREDTINNVKNIEFNETRNRLTDEKIDTLISINGRYKSRRALRSVLKTVFIY